MINNLIDILKEEVILYNEFLSMLREEKKLLCDRRKDELYLFANRLETYVCRLKGVEKMRSGIVEGLAEMYGVAHKTINLSMIINAVDSPYKELLKDLQSRLLAIIESIKELNQENNIIASRSIENINKAFMFLREYSGIVETYKPSGKMAASFQRGK